jgi:hypothetical protein
MAGRRIRCHHEIFVPEKGDAEFYFDLVFSKDAVFVAPEPLLAYFAGDDDGMLGLMVVPGHMPIG